MRMPLANLLGISVSVAFLGLAGQATAQTEPVVTYQGHAIRFASAEQPYYGGKWFMLPVKTVCAKIGASFKKGKDGTRWSIIRGKDRMEYMGGGFEFNGAAMYDEQFDQEVRRGILYVPFEVLKTISGGGLAYTLEPVAMATGSGKNVQILYRNRLVNFKPTEAPFSLNGGAYVAINPTASLIGAKVVRSKDGVRFAITRSRDKIVYVQGQRSFVFNDGQKALSRESVAHAKTVFVPIELFQAFVGTELRAR